MNDPKDISFVPSSNEWDLMMSQLAHLHAIWMRDEPFSMQQEGPKREKEWKRQPCFIDCYYCESVERRDLIFVAALFLCQCCCPGGITPPTTNGGINQIDPIDWLIDCINKSNSSWHGGLWWKFAQGIFWPSSRAIIIMEVWGHCTITIAITTRRGAGINRV